MSVYSAFIFFSALFLPAFYCLGPSDSCDKVNAYSCVYPHGGRIDLGSLEKVENRFVTWSNTTHAYFYQPVRDLVLIVNGSDTQTAGLWLFAAQNASTTALDVNQILLNKINGTPTALASVDTATFEDTELFLEKAKITYTKSADNIGKSVVYLVCDASATTHKLDVAPSEAPYNHSLTLTSPAACAVDLPVERGASGGTVFLVILFTVALAYFGGGALVLKFIRGAEGAEMIPNIDFWKELPSLVKDGFQFLISCGRIRPDTYERI